MILSMDFQEHDARRNINEKHITINLILKNNRATTYWIKVNDRNTRKKCEICSKLNMGYPYSGIPLSSGIYLFKVNKTGGQCVKSFKR